MERYIAEGDNCPVLRGLYNLALGSRVNKRFFAETGPSMLLARMQKQDKALRRCLGSIADGFAMRCIGLLVPTQKLRCLVSAQPHLLGRYACFALEDLGSDDAIRGKLANEALGTVKAVLSNLSDGNRKDNLLQTASCALIGKLAGHRKHGATCKLWTMPPNLGASGSQKKG